MRVLVAGGAGFIGSEFVRALLANNYPELQCGGVTVLDALTYAGRRENLEGYIWDPRLQFVHGSIADVGLVADVVPGHDLIVNFAAESHVDRSIEGPLRFLDANVNGAVTLMDAARRTGVRMLQVGTDEVYGSVLEGSSKEGSPLEPNSPYSASKAAADLFARGYVNTFGADIVVTRCSNNYGPYQFPEKLIPLFVTNLIDGLPVPLYGDGLNVREWLHVSDHCRALALVAAKGTAGETYNIGGGVAATNRSITEILLQRFDCGWEMVRQVADRAGHDRRYAIDDSKVRALGYAPKVSFLAGLNETIDWYIANESWWRPLLARADQE